MQDRRSILIVDDQPIVRESLRDWLKEAGYHVATAENAAQAIDRIDKQDFAVLVVDLRLADQTGISVIREAKVKRPWIKPIVITAYPSPETAAAARKMGAIDYLTKPVSPVDLEKLIKTTLAEAGQESTISKEPVKYKPVITEQPRIKQSFVLSSRDLKA